MPILHRNTKSNLAKFQTGGTIPVYGTFQVQHAQFAPNNPLSLLGKYKGIAGASSPIESKVTESKLPELDGLDNDATAISANFSHLQNQFQAGMDADPNFAESAMGKHLRNKLDLETSRSLVLAKNRKDRYKNNFEQMQTKMSEGAPVFQNGKFMVAKVVQNDDGTYEYDYEMIPASELHKKDEQGNNLYAPLTYGQLADKLNSDMNGMFLNNATTTDVLGYGMGMNYVTNKVLDENYNEIGETAKEWKQERGGDVNEAGDILVKYMSGEAIKTDKAQLEVALSKIKHYMGEPAMDALRGHFWLTSQDETQVEEKINKYLAAHMAQRLGYSISTEDASIWETEAERQLQGTGGRGGGAGGGGPLGELSPYVTEVSGSTAVSYVNHEKNSGLKPVDGKSQNVITLAVWDAPRTTQLLDPKKIMSDQSSSKAGSPGSFGMAGKIRLAESSEGSLLSHNNYKIGNEEVNFLQYSMPATGQTVRVAHVPMKDGAVWRMGLKDLQKMNSQIDAIEKERTSKGSLAQPGSELYNIYEARIEKARKEFLSKHDGVVLQPRYLVDVVYFDPDGNSGQKNIGNVSEDDYKNYIERFGAEEGVADKYSWTNQGDEAIRAYGLKKTTIMVPTNDLIELQQLGAKVYTEKSNLTAGQLEKDETYRSYQYMTEADLYAATRTKAEQAGYSTALLRQLMAQQK